MKFSCDRCKTRYSISDDRVRGKILKIRCKNCSAVITVREGMSVAAPKIPAPSGGSGPSAPTLESIDPPRPKTPPPLPAVTEWFVSIDGEQEGPFDLAGAKRWVKGKPASAELYCWSEGFDDWLPVEKVSHFRGMRPTNGASGPMSVSDPDEKTPAPLFADAMAKMTAEAPTLLEDENPFSAAYERKKRATKEPALSAEPEPEPDLGPLAVPQPEPSALDFEFGEADRVVKLDKDRGGDEGSVPQIRGLTVPETEIPRPEVLQPARRSPLLIPLLAASVILLIVVGVLIYMALSGSDDGDSEVRRTKSRSGAIAAGFDDGRDGQKIPAPDAGATEVAGSTDSGQSKAGGDRETNGSGTGNDTGEETGEKGYTPPAGEVDLSNAGRDDGPVKQGNLDPSDISNMYRKKQFAVNRCYEQAIKRDPLLKVPKTYVTLAIAGSGRVTKVSIPSLDGKPLGRCLVASIGRWKFPKSTEGFNGSFPIVFRSR